MANDLSEYLILKARLGAWNDKKKLQKAKEDYLRDCKYNITTFKTEHTTEFFTRGDKLIENKIVRKPIIDYKTYF